MALLKNLFNRNGDQLAREAIDDYGKGKDEFEVISKLKKALSLGINKYPLDQIYLYIGSSYFDLSIYDKAKEAYETSYQINPNNPSIVSNLGLSYIKLDDTEKALKLYYDSIKLNPNHSYAYHNLGVYFYDCGDHFKSLEYIDKAIAINPGLAESFAIKARCFAHIGRFKEVQKLIKEAKNKGYNNADGLKRELDSVTNDNPKVLWNADKFIVLASAISNENYNLLADIQKAIKDPLAFFRENEERFEEKYLTSFEIYNLLPFNILLDYLLEQNLLVTLSSNDNGYDLICNIENLLSEKYSIDEELFEDLKDDCMSYDLDDLLDYIAAKLKIERSLEIIDLYYGESELLLTIIDTATWNKIKYPFNDNSNSVGRVRIIANEETIENYLADNQNES